MLIYVDQDRMSSSKGAFFENEVFKAIKWKAAVEVVHNLYDFGLADLSAQLQKQETERNRVQQFLESARIFLDQANVPSSDDLDRQVQALNSEQKAIEDTIQRLRAGAQTELGPNLELVNRKEKLEDERAKISARIIELRRNLTQLGRLRVQYERERAQLEFLEESNRLVGSLPVVRCPNCLQAVETERGAIALADHCYVCTQSLPEKKIEVSLGNRLRATKRRVADLEEYIGELGLALSNYQNDLAATDRDISVVDVSLVRARVVALVPDTRPLIEANEALSIVLNRKKQTEDYIALRARARGEGSTLLLYTERVEQLQKAQRDLLLKKQSPQEFIDALSIIYADLLKIIRFPDLRDAYVDQKSFHPFVRGQSYSELMSKGAISLVIAVWHISILYYSLKHGSLFPRILMLDSPLSHVGQDSSDSEFKDQKIVDAFFDMLWELHKNYNGRFQLLLTINRPPAKAKGLPIIEFTGNPRHGRYGLIDDEVPPSLEPEETDIDT